MATVEVEGQTIPIENVNFTGDDRRDIGRLAKGDHAQTAAAMVATELAASFLGPGAGSQQTQQNAARIVEELSGQLEQPQAGPEPAAVLEPPAVAEPPALDYQLPDDIAHLLDDTDDFEDEEEPEPEPVATLPDDDEDEYVDPQVAELRNQVKAAEKKAAHERGLRVEAARTGWEAEARRVFNQQIELVSDDEISAIDADSKRGFFRQAKEVADRNRKIAERFAPKAAATAPELVTRDTRAQEWGPPAGGAPAASADSVGYQQRLEAAQRTGRLSNVIKAMIYPEG